MWFVFALLTALAWGGADLFYKKGTDSNDKLSHIKIIIMVGLVMGIHATGYLLFKGITFHPIDLLTYLPVSGLYILSMAIGYIGLRYLELSIASPIQNSSGAVTAILIFIFFTHELGVIEVLGLIIITLGVIGIAVLEKRPKTKPFKIGLLKLIKNIKLALWPLFSLFFMLLLMD